MSFSASAWPPNFNKLPRVLKHTLLDFSPEESQAASIVEKAYKRSLSVITDLWSIQSSKRIRIYIESNYFYSTFKICPWYYYIFQAIDLSFNCIKNLRVWRHTGGFASCIGEKAEIIMQPWRYLKQKSESLYGGTGAEIFNVEFCDIENWTELAVCHEMTHIIFAHLTLPFWLNEGIAMVTTDKYFGKQTVRNDTLQQLSHSKRNISPVDYHELWKSKERDIDFHYIRAYWITRFFMETHLDLIFPDTHRATYHRQDDL